MKGKQSYGMRLGKDRPVDFTMMPKAAGVLSYLMVLVGTFAGRVEEEKRHQ